MKKPRAPSPPEHDAAKAVRRTSEKESAAQTERDPNTVVVMAEKAHRVEMYDPDTTKHPGETYELPRQKASQLFANGIISYVSQEDEEIHYDDLGRSHADGVKARRLSTGPV